MTLLELGTTGQVATGHRSLAPVAALGCNVAEPAIPTACTTLIQSRQSRVEIGSFVFTAFCLSIVY